MSTVLNPYLNFRGQTREAMTFYQSVFGGQLDVMTYADLGGDLAAMGVTEAESGQVMHSMLTVSDSVHLMAADVPSKMEGEFPHGQIALSGDDHDTLQGWFAGLGEGGTIHVPLEKAPWGDWFGQLADRYGVTWMVNASGSDGS
jgi:PhnB protein